MTDRVTLGLHAKLNGFMTWKLLRRDGSIAQQGGGKNVILNQGLDLAMIKQGVADQPCGWPTFIGTERLIAYVAVGTGNSTPDVTQTALDNEIGRSGHTLNLGDCKTITKISDGVFDLGVTRAFDYDEANGNLTEYGGAIKSSGANTLGTRELFRDGNGNPVTVTKTSDNRLVINYILRIALTPIAPTVQGTVNWYDSDGSTVVLQRDVSVCWHKGKVHSNYSEPYTDGCYHIFNGLYKSGDYATYPKIYWFSSDFDQSGYNIDPTAGNRLSANREPYTNGTYYREWTAELLASGAKTVYGIYPQTENGSTYTRGLTFKFVDSNGDPDPINKEDGKKLGFKIRFSVARGS